MLDIRYMDGDQWILKLTCNVFSKLLTILEWAILDLLTSALCFTSCFCIAFCCSCCNLCSCCQSCKRIDAWEKKQEKYFTDLSGAYENEMKQKLEWREKGQSPEAACLLKSIFDQILLTKDDDAILILLSFEHDKKKPQ